MPKKEFFISCMRKLIQKNMRMKKKRLNNLAASIWLMTKSIKLTKDILMCSIWKYSLNTNIITSIQIIKENMSLLTKLLAMNWLIDLTLIGLNRRVQEYPN